MKWFVAAAIALLSAAAADQPAAPSCSVLSGSTQSGPARSYQADNLFEYMDGNSEAYLLYGFVRMQGVTCVGASGKVLIDISEMQDAESAYGMFSSNLDIKLPTGRIGAASQVVPRKAIFVKDRYFGEIAAESEGDHSALLRTAAVNLEARIPGSTAAPEPIAWFPAEGLTAGPPRLIPESVLGIGVLKRGYVAQYGSAKAFIVSEASEQAAMLTLEKLRKRFGAVEPLAAGEEGLQTDDKYLGRLGIARRGRRLAGYARLPAGSDAASKLSALLARIPE